MNDYMDCIDRWAYIAHLSQTLLDLAKLSEWEQLMAREEDYLRAVENVMQDQSVTIDQKTRNIIEGHLRTTLNNESLLEKLLYKRLDDLSQLIGQSVRQRAINTTYGKFSGMILGPNNNSTVQ